jgi:GAF domain-containing protein
MESMPDSRPVEMDGDEAADERFMEDEDLRASVASLATLATGQLRLEEVLTEVATFAVRAIPGADGAGLTLWQHDRTDTMVTTAPFVREIDELQYGLGQGPSITAAADQQTVISGSLGADPRWPRFGARAARLGVHSAVSLPLITAGTVVGALNVYAHAKHTFDDRAAELGELFAVPAAIAVQNAQILDQARRLAIFLQQTLDSRGVIDRAIGILMSRSGDSEQEALARLRTLSQHEHRKLLAVAHGIVDEARRRAQARHSADG